MSKITVLAPQQIKFTAFEQGSLMLQNFDPLVMDFIHAFSQQLMKDVAAKQHAELVALGFWLRSGNLKKMQKQVPAGVIKPLGWVVHFTPANVDTMFVYSWICSLLMGNHNVVRVATKQSELRDCLLALLCELFSQSRFAQLGRHNLFIQYDKQSKHSALLSAQSDGRIIWGGDQSVLAIRGLPCKPRCRDISFADRYSACVINANALQSQEQLVTLASRLTRDARPYDQQACSSPRILFWLGEDAVLPDLVKCLDKQSASQTKSITTANNQLVYSQLVKSQLANVEQFSTQNICVLKVPQLNVEQQVWHTGEGIYIVHPIASLTQLGSLCDEKLQTLSYWGVDKTDILKLLEDGSILGLDRVVPVGHALDFSPVWDGFDLFNQLCRRILLE